VRSFIQRGGAKAIPRTQPVNRRWLPLNALRAFDAVGQRLSFTAGANALNVSQSAVSRHIISLEELLGHKLFDRSGATLKDEAGGARLRREDPCGRRSLTGLEFRRQRSA